jgi:hypothetical protein
LGAGIMADATYQLTGKPGVLVATLGPGITNTTTAVAQALLDRSAVIVLTGEIATTLKSIYTHQIIDQESLLRPLVKWSTTIAARNAFDQVRKGLALAKLPDARSGAFQCADGYRGGRAGGIASIRARLPCARCRAVRIGRRSKHCSSGRSGHWRSSASVCRSTRRARVEALHRSVACAVHRNIQSEGRRA